MLRYYDAVSMNNETKAGNVSVLVVVGNGEVFVYSYDVIERHGGGGLGRVG